MNSGCSSENCRDQRHLKSTALELTSLQRSQKWHLVNEKITEMCENKGRCHKFSFVWIFRTEWRIAVFKRCSFQRALGVCPPAYLPANRRTYVPAYLLTSLLSFKHTNLQAYLSASRPSYMPNSLGARYLQAFLQVCYYRKLNVNSLLSGLRSIL